MFNPKVKTVSSTSTVTFRNTQGSYYDMIISIQNQTINQSISITDTEGNNVTENPIVLTVPAKVILKDVQVGSITFSDSNSYNVIISYIVKTTASGIPYIDVDYQNGYTYTQEVSVPTILQKTISGGTPYNVQPPSGKKWKIRNITIGWEASATQTDIVQVQIFPNISNYGYIDWAVPLNVVYDSISVTANDIYIVDMSEYVQSRSGVTVGVSSLTEQTVNGSFELYSTENLRIIVNNEASTTDIYIVISYIEVNVG